MIKRIIDITISAFLILLLSPIFILAAIAIRFISGSSFIYKQERIGFYGQRFNIYKFTSMENGSDKRLKELQHLNESKDGVLFKMKNDPRITLVGKFIRKISIDELPQLFNVLKGDMSIVGPRPQLQSEVDKYKKYQYARLSVKPGITCLAQISGRSSLTFKEWIEWDLEYIETQSVWLDIKIMALTAIVVLKCKHSY